MTHHHDQQEQGTPQPLTDRELSQLLDSDAEHSVEITGIAAYMERLIATIDQLKAERDEARRERDQLNVYVGTVEKDREYWLQRFHEVESACDKLRHRAERAERQAGEYFREVHRVQAAFDKLKAKCERMEKVVEAARLYEAMLHFTFHHDGKPWWPGMRSYGQWKGDIYTNMLQRGYWIGDIAPARGLLELNVSAEAKKCNHLDAHPDEQPEGEQAGDAQRKERGAAVEIEVRSWRNYGATTVARSIIRALKDAGFNVRADAEHYTRIQREHLEHGAICPDPDNRLILIRDTSIEKPGPQAQEQPSEDAPTSRGKVHPTEPWPAPPSELPSAPQKPTPPEGYEWTGETREPRHDEEYAHWSDGDQDWERVDTGEPRVFKHTSRGGVLCDFPENYAILRRKPVEPTADEPAACPWCGSETDVDEHNGKKAVYCSSVDCDAVGPIKPTPDDAIAAWNRIASKPARPEQEG